MLPTTFTSLQQPREHGLLRRAAEPRTDRYLVRARVRVGVLLLRVRARVGVGVLAQIGTSSLHRK